LRPAGVMHKIFVLVMIVTVITSTAVGKCANRFVNVAGHVDGRDTDGLEVVVKTIPDANWERQPRIIVKQGEFEGVVYFDSTKIEGKVRDKCSRAPDMVDVLLFKGKQQIDALRLVVSKDFVRDESGDYKLRSPIQFHQAGSLGHTLSR
jgi:hypothetical protein